MAQALHRRWRPQTFAALLGQDPIRDTLGYALTHNQGSQAYLFCGPRGTGKTTTARLVAKAVNCLEEKRQKPCNRCQACRTITEGTNLDVLELDAASNRGIEEIRQLRETVRFAPTQAKEKIFIIDEVHMLTREAFNALLKTLEEPPPQTIFILATTEAHKVPPTIVSRCQRFDFRLPSRELLARHLLSVAKGEEITLDPEAADFLARLAEGSFRDALTLLEQVTLVKEKRYTRKVVEALFGYIPREELTNWLAAILESDLPRAHQALDNLLAGGGDIRALGDQLLVLSQEVLEAVAREETATLPPPLGPLADKLSLERVVGWIEGLLAALQTMKQSPVPRLPLDLAVTKFATFSQREVASSPLSDPPLPQAPSSMEGNGLTEEAVTPRLVQVAEATVPLAETVRVPVAATMPERVEAEEWRKILTRLKEEAPSLVASLAHATLGGIDGNLLTVAVRYKMHAEKINQPTNRLKIEGAMAGVLGVPMRIAAEVVAAPSHEETVDLVEIFEFEEEG